MKNFAVIILLLLLNQGICLGQKKKFTSDSKKAVDHFQKGLDYYDTRRLPDATDEFIKALKIDSNFIEAHMMLAETYMDLNKVDKAIYEFKASIKIDPDYFPQNYFNLAKMEMNVDKFEDAKIHFEKALSYQTLPPPMIKNARRFLASCTFAVEALKHPVPFKPINIGDSINTRASEYCPAITADEKTIYYTVLRPNENFKGGNGFGVSRFQEDIFDSENKSNHWSTGRSVSNYINTFDNEGALCISADGQTLYYTVCNRPGDFGSCDIYFVKKIGNVWGNPRNIGPPINTKSFESQPSISADGMTLYFAGARPGGFGKVDIWKSKKQADGQWGEPINLGPKINTPEADQSPFIHADGRTLYYTSEGLPGMGGEDFYLSRLDNNGEWSTPKNLGYPINSIANERSIIVNAMGNKAYFASERLGGFGQYDVFYFDLPQEIRPFKVSYVKGKVFDSESNQNLETKFELIDLQTSQVVAEAYSDKVSGEFLVCLPTDKDYALNISKPGYLFYSENFSLKANTNIKDAMLMDVPLKTIQVGRSVILKNIFFNTNSYDLKDESKAELGKLIAFLNTNPKVKIEISGHTDNVGNDQSNQILSGKRAKAVLDYLTTAGIVKERLTSKGFGEIKPIAPNTSEEGKALNRRTEFMVTGI